MVNLDISEIKVTGGGGEGGGQYIPHPNRSYISLAQEEHVELEGSDVHDRNNAQVVIQLCASGCCVYPILSSHSSYTPVKACLNPSIAFATVPLISFSCCRLLDDATSGLG